MTNVLELSSEDTAQPLYALALPFGTSINEVSTELQTEFLQNQLQAIQTLVNQAQQNQCDDISNLDNSLENADTIEEIIQEEGSWTVPVCPTDENSLNVRDLDVIQSQSILNGISDEIENIEYLIEEDEEDQIETIEQSKDCDTRYMISLNGMQYGFKLVPALGNNNLHCPQVKILLNSDNNTNELNNSDPNTSLSTIESNHDDEINDIAEVVQAYKCRECYFTVEDKQLLIEHYKTEHVEKVTKVKEESFVDSDNITNKVDEIEVKSEQMRYMCGQCSQGYASIEECRIHMIKDHNLTGKTGETEISSDFKNNFSSNEICLTSMLDENNMDMKDTKESHWLLLKNFKELKSVLISNWKSKCSINNCPYRFKDNESLDQHLRCHVVTTKTFSCFECHKEFFNWRTCSVHLWRDHMLDVDMLTCPICKDYKTPTAVKLSHHMKIHGMSRGFVCGECGKAFKQVGQLNNHKVIHTRSRKKSQTQRWYTAKKCEICLKTFADSKCLKKHIQAIHSKIRPFICNVCGHSCSRKAMLQMHLRQHTGEKPYACNECDYRTSDHNTLRRHMMRHTGVRPYSCLYCPYAAIQSSAFKLHMRTKHKDKPGIFTCKDCPFKTVNKSIYESHMSDHELGLIDRKCDKSNPRNWKLHPEESGNGVYPHNASTSRTMYHNLRDVDQSFLNSNSAPNEISTRDSEDEDTQHCFLTRHQNIDNSEEAIDTGGVTIPADMEINSISH